MKSCRIAVIALLLLLFPAILFAEEEDDQEEEEKPLPIGNFALPLSQQPAPLVSFGQTMVDKGVVQLFLFGDGFFGNHQYTTDLFPAVIYGLTEKLTLYITLPFSPRSRYGKSHSSGLEDLYLQGELLLYDKDFLCSSDQLTLVVAFGLPTGSAVKAPPTGFGTAAFFIGGTFSHLTVQGLLFTSHGINFAGSNHGTRFGSQFLYQFGFGRALPSRAETIWLWMVEVDGTYSWQDRIQGAINPDSGGNVVYLTPSIWFSSKKAIVQFGIGYPVVQTLFGDQFRDQISLDFNLGITF